MLLDGLKVVELATWVAGPGAAAIMADWGADVIKVESAGGDPTRGFYPDDAAGLGNPIFTMANRGKRGIVVDLAGADGRAALLALLAQADVFVTNLRPGSLARAGLDHETVRRGAPRLVYASVSGVGLEGPDVDLPAFDITGFWSRSGIAAATIPPDQAPFACRPGFGDHVTALAVLAGILAALRERDATGEGRLVEASLLRTGTYALGWDLGIQARFGVAVTAQPRDERPLPFHGYHRTADARWVCLVPRGPACFDAMLRLVGRADLIGAPELAPPGPPLALVRELRAAADRLFAALTLAEAGTALTAADVIWAPMLTPAEVVASAAAAHAGCFAPVAGDGAATLSPAAPVRFGGDQPAPPRRAPRLDEHGAAVRAALPDGWPARPREKESIG